MPLIINSNGKVQYLEPTQKIVKQALRSITSSIFQNFNFFTATGEALDRLSDLYAIKRVINVSPQGELCEENDEELRTRLQLIRK